MRIVPITIAACFALAALPALRAETGAGKSWMDHYSESPRQTDFVTGVLALNRDGYFASENQRFVAIGFLAQVFKQNPGEVNEWLQTAVPLLPNQGQRALLASAWLARNPASYKYLHDVHTWSSGDQRDAAEEMMGQESVPAVADIPVTSVHAMDLQWGAFLASGDGRYIENVFAAFGSNRPGLATEARYTLVQYAAGNPKVLQICRDVLARQPDAVRAQFQAALNEAAVSKPGV